MQFRDIFLGNLSPEGVLAFWNHVKLQEPWKHHGVLRALSSEDLKRTIPFCVHSDGAEMFTNMEYQVYSWSSAFGILGMIKDVFVQKFAIAIISCNEMLDDSVP